MEKLKSSLTNMVLVLVGVAVVIGAVLAWVNNITEQPIAEKAQQTLAAGIKEVMNSTDIKVEDPDTVKMEIQGKESVFTIHNVYTTDGAYLGSAVESTTMGFGGDLKVLVGFNAEGTILGYTILQASETPGLGAKADKWFQKDGKGNIIGKSVANGELKVNKDGGDVDAITASTITSRAFLKAVNQAYTAYQDNHAANAKGADGASGASVQHN
jgi:Na+-translocating ferredoxin:NAD+ oxidoreductase subunit G